MRKLYIIVLFIKLINLWAVHAAAAEENKRFHFSHAEFGSHVGFVWPHHPDLDNLYRGGFPMFQLALSGMPRGHRPWHHTYKFPETGITIMYSHLGYPQVLGNAWGLLPHINFSLFRGKRVSLQLRYGAGVAWLTNRYREPDNLENQAISAPLNITMNTTLQATMPLLPGLWLRGGFGMTHFSNGKSATPNKGLNIPSAKLELVGRFNNNPLTQVRIENAESFDPYNMAVYLATGYTALYPPGGAKYAEFTLSTAFGRRLSAKSGLNLGADVFFGFSDRALLIRQNQAPPSLATLIKPGIHLGYEQFFTNTSFIIQQGIYLYAANDADGKTYNRMGFRHRVGDRWILNLTIKSHLFRADYLEWGAGFRVF